MTQETNDQTISDNPATAQAAAIQMPEGYVPVPEDQSNLDLLNDTLRDMRDLFGWTTPLGDPDHWTSKVTIEAPGQILAAEAALLCRLNFAAVDPMTLLLIQSRDSTGKVYQGALLKGGENTPPSKLKTIVTGKAYDTPGRAVLSLLGACMVGVERLTSSWASAKKKGPKAKKPKRSLRN